MAASDGQGPVWWENDRVTFGGLLGLATVSVGQLLGSQPLSPLLTAALFCFVFALPFLYRSLRQTLEGSSHTGSSRRRAKRRGLDALGVFGAFSGFTLLVFQLNVWAGAFFLACCLGVVLLVVWL